MAKQLICPKCKKKGTLELFTPKEAGGVIKHKWHRERVGSFNANIIDECCLFTYAETIEHGLNIYHVHYNKGE